jgi:hypothetical protein
MNNVAYWHIRSLALIGIVVSEEYIASVITVKFHSTAFFKLFIFEMRYTLQ